MTNLAGAGSGDPRTTRKSTTAFDRIVPALIHIQAHLDQDLSLDLLADEVGLSKFHFHQMFKKATGETPKTYVDRLRLERAAVQLGFRRSSVFEIALECGYQNHETFSRAFHDHFGMSPRDYRKDWFRQSRGKQSTRGRRTTIDVRHARLSPTRIVQLKRMIVAFIRHVGPYEGVAFRNFKRLTDWTRRNSLGSPSPLQLGIARDAPGITPADKIRFDCCVEVSEVFDADGDIACQRTPGGVHAVTDYVGSWDLRSAYRAIFDRLCSDSSVEVIGLPVIEIYQTIRVGPRHGLAQESIAVPVRRR